MLFYYSFIGTMAEKFLNPEFLKEFIDMYHSLPCLWKVKSQDYSNRHKRNEAYAKLNELCKRINPASNVDFIKNKISNLRTVFKKEYNKVQSSKKSGASADDVYVPRLWYYDLLTFTIDQEVSRNSLSSYETNEQLQSQNDTISEFTQATASSINESTQNNTVNNEVQPSTPRSEVQLSTPRSEVQLSTPRSQSNANKNRKRKQRIDDFSNQILTDAEALLHKPGDEFEAFSYTVASKLRRMDEDQRLISELLISDILAKGLQRKHHPVSLNPQPSSSTYWPPCPPFPNGTPQINNPRTSTPSSILDSQLEASFHTMGGSSDSVYTTL
ncbi:uncharacterized protein LOC108716617 isoform X1 [Xenopus laevis]|uniref:Uncharacterized protein LOC108716617 isoform X1 n=2 Tax=Xenopus laevis TaxID=8355 RepID=A0A8J0VBD1_XENLA|nr:uncharacterized protein LOC108716617 isoform X1 [Xenopus laevis]